MDTFDEARIGEFLGGKTVLITGGGGSIGSALARAVAPHAPKRLVLFDICENSAYLLSLELKRKYPALPVNVRIGSIRDGRRMEEIFGEYRPEAVFHAAAHKHVPLMEDDPREAVKNNVFGTLNCARCADAYGAEAFILLSTDKAVCPASVMGATKRVCEKIVQSYEGRSATRFAAVRFGNVLGSAGSVLPIFEQQIAEGGPVTVTHHDAVRYFMTAEEAAGLVLCAGAYARTGEIFVLDMGEPVKIADLARDCIARSGKKIAICYTGLRSGEKLSEERLTGEEGLRMTEHGKICVAPPIPFDRGEFEAALEELRSVCDAGGDVRPVLKRLVPTYRG